MDMEGIKKLLSEVGKIRAKVESYNQASGRCFNIFSIANIATDEVKICRVLHALLDPKGPHHQQAVFLKLFIEKVLRPNRAFTEDDYKNAVVLREFTTAVEGRRIDIFIQIGGENIPIEAKIYAGDQNEQCECYAKYATDKMPVYYLTPDGHEPANFSRGKLPTEKLELRSFADDILPWLDECLRLPSVIRIAPIREVILQLQDTIREFTGIMENDMKDDMLGLVDSAEGIRNALDICRLFEEVHSRKLNKIFEILDEKIREKYVLERYVQANDYTRVKAGRPGISYKIGEHGKGICCLRVEIPSGWCYAGLCVLDDKRILEQNKEQELKTLWVEGGNWDTPEPKWPVWNYVDCPHGRPDFNSYNDAYCDLWNEKHLAEFIENIMKLVKEIVEAVNKRGLFSIVLK